MGSHESALSWQTLTGGTWAARRNHVFNSPVRLFPTRTLASCESAARFETESDAELLSWGDSGGAHGCESVTLRGLSDWRSSSHVVAVGAAMENSRVFRRGVLGLTRAHSSVDVVRAEVPRRHPGCLGFLNEPMRLSSERLGIGLWAGVPNERLARYLRQVPVRFTIERRPAGSAPAKLPLGAARLLSCTRAICRLL